MEDRGYLVAHPTLIDPKGHAPAEQQHITHKVTDYEIFFFCFVKLRFWSLNSQLGVKSEKQILETPKNASIIVGLNY